MSSGGGVLRLVPLAKETTFSFLCRVAACYGVEEQAFLSRWQAVNHRARHEGGAVRADGEVLLDAAAGQSLGVLCGVGDQSLGRALPPWGRGDPKLDGKDGRGRVVGRVGSAVVGPVAFGCLLCTARRAGVPGRVVRYAARWERVCVQHGRWALDADADQPLEYLDVRGVPEVGAAQRRWWGVARRAVRARGRGG